MKEIQWRRVRYIHGWLRLAHSVHERLATRQCGDVGWEGVPCTRSAIRECPLGGRQATPLEVQVSPRRSLAFPSRIHWSALQRGTWETVGCRSQSEHQISLICRWPTRGGELGVLRVHEHPWAHKCTLSLAKAPPLKLTRKFHKIYLLKPTCDKYLKYMLD